MEHKLSPVATPACRAPAGHPRSMQWWSFIVSLVSSKRMTCSSAMYSDTATLTLKYHIRHITMCLGTRGVRKNRSVNHHGGEDFAGSKFDGRRRPRALSRFPLRNPRAGDTRGSKISISRREKLAQLPPRIDRE